DSIGLNGLMTFGVYPRYWGEAGYDGEVDCGAGADPTPDEHWDDTFWCSAWTDYHNTVSTAQVWAMRTGDVEWLDEIAFPGALRTLHTQIMQCSPTTSWFYCGQSPTGYGAYRTDFNSSHAYFENLILYYWLTGDQTVLDIVQRGADSMRRWECPQRGPNPVVTPHGPDGPACAADYPINDPNATLTGRVGEQWQYVFRFMGLASNDASFLDDFRLNFARMITQLYVAPVQNGVTYGFWGGPAVMPSSSAGTTTLTDSQWTIGMYDMHYLSRYQRDSGDAPLGIPALKPSQVISSIAHTYKDFDAVVYGDGTVSGLWARLLQYTWSGPRLGGTLMGPVVESDRELYDPEKTGAAEILIRAGQQEGNASLVDFGRQLTIYMLSDAAKENVPLGKLMGQDLTRIHPAVALLANGSGSAPPPVAPTGLTALAVSTSAINLSWQESSTDVSSFHVQQLVNGTYQEVQVLGPSGTSVQIGGLAAATPYSFRVTAANASGVSANSNVASATTQTPPPPPGPAAPANLTAKGGTVAGTVQLTWTDNSTDEISFRIEELIGGTYQAVYAVGANVTTAQTAGLTPGASYSFRVRAANAAGYSAYCNVATGTSTPGTPPPTAPQITSATALGGGAVQVNWRDNSSTEAQFVVESSLNGTTFQTAATLAANSITAKITGLTQGVKYYFRVKAVDALGQASYSTVMMVTVR
ncbi:MAG TPA: fibronectin type III domain-containing protein, partial [Thermoanaerobaculia bacterium]